MYSSIASASSESRATSPGTPLVRHSAGTSSESAGTLGMKPHASASVLSGSEVSLSCRQICRCLLQTVLSVLKVLQNHRATTLEDSTKKTAQKPNKDTDDDGQVDEIGLQRVEVKSETLGSQ